MKPMHMFQVTPFNKTHSGSSQWLLQLFAMQELHGQAGPCGVQASCMNGNKCTSGSYGIAEDVIQQMFYSLGVDLKAPHWCAILSVLPVSHT